MTNHKLRIHGDNILECESGLKLLASSLSGGVFRLKSGPAYAPIYEFKSDHKEYFEVQLFAGYGRWGFPLVEYIASLGGTLREAPDAIITRLEIKGGKLYERPILAFEFSGALPAGNNAWQRTGRALALAYAGIPYLYFAELGGQELDAKRAVKAARFPNPLVPFAYAVLGMSSNSISLPVYIPSPSSHKNIIEIYKDDNIPEEIEVQGQTLYLPTPFHVSLVYIGKIIEKYNISIPDFLNKIIRDFCEFTKTHEIEVVRYNNEFKFATREDKKTVVVMCEVSNLNRFFDLINQKYELNIKYMPTHVTLYGNLRNKPGIWLMDEDDIKTLTIPIENPIGYLL